MKNLYLLLIEALCFACKNSNTALNDPILRTKKIRTFMKERNIYYDLPVKEHE